jgi:hypothetical protein
VVQIFFFSFGLGAGSLGFLWGLIDYFCIVEGQRDHEDPTFFLLARRFSRNSAATAFLD